MEDFLGRNGEDHTELFDEIISIIGKEAFALAYTEFNEPDNKYFLLFKFS